MEWLHAPANIGLELKYVPAPPHDFQLAIKIYGEVRKVQATLLSAWQIAE